MKHTTSALRIALLSAVATSLAHAQITTVATETFEYPVPGLVHDGAGGTGWSTSWFVTPDGANADVVMFDNTIMPNFSLSDGVGGHAGQAAAFGAGFRRLDTSLHPDITNANGKYGEDGATVWVSFSSQLYQGQPFEHYGGLSLFNVGVGEEVFLGSPWNTNAWGFDDEADQGAPAVVIPGSDNSAASRLVYRIDFGASGERMRMWIDPAVPHPTSAADLDTPLANFEFDEIRISSGGNNGDHFFWDDIVIEKGKPAVGAQLSSCATVANSTGVPSVTNGFGSEVAADNDLTLIVSDLPPNSFGFLLSARTPDFVANPGGSLGNLCLGPDVGRGVGGFIFNTGAGGMAVVDADLNAMPTSMGPVSAMPGETWYIQCWHRDASGGQAVSNLSSTLEITLQ